MICIDKIPYQSVALRKESVDRNNSPHGQKYINRGSLSARRAWIEIPALLGNPQNDGVALRKESVDRNGLGVRHYRDDVVALRKESVDRNPKLYKALAHVRWSLSARRAWIEIVPSDIKK